MERIEGNNNAKKIETVQPEPVKKPIEQSQPETIEVKTPPLQFGGSPIQKRNLAVYGEQRREEINSIVPGVNAASTFREVQLNKAMTRADAAYQDTFKQELQSFADYKAKVDKGADVTGHGGAKNYLEVVARAEKSYTNELNRSGFNAADVRGRSALKAADFLLSPANRSGDLTSLSAQQIRTRVTNGEKPSYLVRLVEPKYMDAPDTRLAAPFRKFAWVASADELAGTKGDLFETMRRIGYKESDIEWTRGQIADGKKSVSDYALAVVETDAAKVRTTPLWETVINDARGKTDFVRFAGNPPEFWEDVKNFQHDGMDYDAHVDRMGKTDLDIYTAKFPTEKKQAFAARLQIQNEYGANPLFTGDGTTLRPDAQNGRVGAREWFVENVPLREQQKTSFIPLQDLGVGDNPKIKTQTSVRNIAENPLRLRGEMRSGAILGGTISAVTSLPEVFEKAQQGDYAGAAQTFATRTGTGAFIGTTSAAGERIVGRSAEKFLTNSPLATRAFEKLSENGVANRFASRLISSETSAISSGAFTGVARQVMGRVAGGSIIGGVVNGAFSAYDQIGALNRGEVTGSQAIGTITGEVSIGLAAGATGAMAGALIGSVIPIAGTAVGAVVGFVVGVGVGMATDFAARHFGADKFIARNVTALIDNAPRVFESVKQFGADAVQSVQTAVTSKIAEARQVVNRISDAGRTAQTFINQKVAGAKQKFSQATEAATQFVSQAKRQVGQTVNRAVNAVQNRVNQVVNRARAVTNRVSNAARTAQTFVNQTVTRARQTVSRATNAVSSFVAQTRQNVTNTVRSAVNNVTTRVQNTVNNAVSNARATVSNAVSNFAGNAVGNLKSVFGW